MLNMMVCESVSKVPPKESRKHSTTFLNFIKEVDEFIDSCEDLSEIAMPRLQKKGHRSFGQTEHNLGKSTFEYFSRQCYEIFDTAAVKLQSCFDAFKPGLNACCSLFNSLFDSVDDEIKQYPEIISDELKMKLVVFTKRWKPSHFNEYLEILQKSPEEVKAFFPNILRVIKLQDTATILPVSDAFFIYIFTKLHYHERFRHNFWSSSGISKLKKLCKAQDSNKIQNFKNFSTYTTLISYHSIIGIS